FLLAGFSQRLAHQRGISFVALSQKVFGYLGWPKTWILPGLVADDLRYTRGAFGTFFQVVRLLIVLKKTCACFQSLVP
ncbi:MAG: hypothetical protein ACK6A7_23180, partial [Planctomycetota bacterium]